MLIKINMFVGGISHVEEANSVIWDMGSLYLRAGFGGEERPKVIFPSVITTQQVGLLDAEGDSTLSADPQGLILGEGVLQRRDHMRVEPIYNTDSREGHIEPNWDYLEQTINHVFTSSLAVNPDIYNCLFTESNLPSRTFRTRLAELMFEKFQVPGIYLARSAVLAS